MAFSLSLRKGDLSSTINRTQKIRPLAPKGTFGIPSPVVPKEMNKTLAI